MKGSVEEQASLFAVSGGGRHNLGDDLIICTSSDI
jgi:hypothetical protein